MPCGRRSRACRWLSCGGSWLGWEWGLGASDEEVAWALRELAVLHPGSVAASAWPAVTVLITVSSPARVVTLTPDGTLVARSPEAQTVAWAVGRVVASRAGTELVVEDAGGTLHTLGVVESVTVLEQRWKLFDAHSPANHFPLPRTALGDAVFVVQCTDGTMATIGHALQVDSASRRDAQRELLRGWERVEQCVVEQPLEVRVAGGEVRRIGDAVEAVWRVE